MPFAVDEISRRCIARPEAITVASLHRPNLSKIAQTMFKSIKTFISSLVEDEGFRNRTESNKCQLATAALLTRVTTVHSEMSQARRAKLHTVLKLHFDLVLLRHKFIRSRRAAEARQQGHRGKRLTSASMMRRRTVAIEFGTWRSGRNGGSSGSVTVGYGKLREPRGGTRS